MKLNSILKNLEIDNIKNLNYEELIFIKNIRNEKEIRKNMFTKHLISHQEHINWFKRLKKINSEKFYCIKYKKQIIGGLGLKYLNKNINAYWSFYISKKANFSGLGATIEYMALDYFFSKYRLNKIYCYVLKKNPLVIKLHEKFGFKKKSKFNKKKLDYINESDVINLELKSQNWFDFKKKFEKKYLT